MGLARTYAASLKPFIPAQGRILSLQYPHPLVPLCLVGIPIYPRVCVFVCVGMDALKKVIYLILMLCRLCCQYCSQKIKIVQRSYFVVRSFVRRMITKAFFELNLNFISRIDCLKQTLLIPVNFSAIIIFIKLIIILIQLRWFFNYF